MTKILLDTVSLLGVSWGYGIPMDVLLEGSRGRGCKDLPVDRERVLPDQSSMGEGEQKGEDEDEGEGEGEGEGECEGADEGEGEGEGEGEIECACDWDENDDKRVECDEHTVSTW